MSLLLFLILLVGDNTSKTMKWIHTAYSGCLFGAFAALLIPHLEGLSYMEMIAFFGEHILIWPLGPLVLYRKYGYSFPGWKDHCTGKGVFFLYHFLNLVSIF